jgi:HD-like signal output (HDOD) protein
MIVSRATNKRTEPGETVDHYRILHTLQNMESIGAIPAISLKVFDRINDPRHTFNEIAYLLMQDQAMCAQILKIANSVYYSRGKRIATVSQAVAHLGTDTIKKILFAVEVMGIYPCNAQEAKFSGDSFWRHTLAGAISAYQIAMRNKFENDESFYLAALLRNLGILIIRQYFPDVFKNACDMVLAEKVSFYQAEERLMGLTHREIARLIAIRWGLPQEILLSYGPDTSEVGMMQTINDVVRGVDAVLREKGFEQWDQYGACVYPADFKQNFNLTDEFVTHLCDSVFTEVNELSAILGMKV